MLVSEFGHVPNTVIRVFKVSVSTLVLIGTFFIFSVSTREMRDEI